MKLTPNYGLYTESNADTNFKDWREAISGESESNFVKIDEELGKKSDKSRSFSTALLSSAWSGANAPFTQSLSVDQLGADQNGTISIAHNATIEQRDVAREAMLSVVGQSENQLIISADGELPELDIPVVVIIFG